MRRRFLALCLLVACPLFGAPATRWIATWAASPQPAAHGGRGALLTIRNQTVRERVRISVGGTLIRLRLSNEYGASPLVIDSVSVAIPDGPANVRAGSIRRVTFGGRSAIAIPPGAPMLSDPVPFRVGYGEEISISLHFPERVETPTLHALALKRGVVSKEGDFTHALSFDGGAVVRSSIALTGVLVPAAPRQRLVVAFGDSLTDGDGSTLDADHNWPAELVRRLRSRRHVAVINEGVIGNRMLNGCADAVVGCFSDPGLARFDRDVLAQPGVTHLVLLEGINDLGFPGAKIGEHLLADPSPAPAADDIIAAYQQLIARAHARGIRVIGGTITPFEGVDLPGYWSESKEAMRQTINRWIRHGGAFDGIIDFDAMLRDPAQPSRLSPKFASNDHLHPNDAGYRVVADAIDLDLFE